MASGIIISIGYCLPGKIISALPGNEKAKSAGQAWIYGFVRPGFMATGIIGKSPRIRQKLMSLS